MNQYMYIYIYVHTHRIHIYRHCTWATAVNGAHVYSEKRVFTWKELPLKIHGLGATQGVALENNVMGVQSVDLKHMHKHIHTDMYKLDDDIE